MNYELEIVEVTTKQPAKIYHLYLSQYHYMKQHFHHNVELVYVLKGSFVAHVNGIDTFVKKDSLFLINAYYVHYFEMIEDSEMITVLLSYDMLREYEENIDAIEFDLQLHISQHDILKNTILKMDQYRKGNESYKEIKVQEYLCSIYYLLLRYFQKPKQIIPKIHHIEDMQNILEYIEEHYNQSIIIEELSQRFHYSPSYLCRYFKKTCGMTILQYVKTIRLNHAFLDICNSNKDISIIAYEHGFANTKSFIQTFKEKYHQTPGAYRKSLGQ